MPLLPVLLPLLSLLLPPVSAEVCSSWNMGATLAEIGGTPIIEASGVAWARTRPGVYFTHNDAGGAAEIYAFMLDGTFVETHALEGGSFRDWEDMSAGPCPDKKGHCLYMGDIGDNGRSRTDGVSVFAMREPAAGSPAVVIATWNAVYPTSPQDSETLFVHPRTGRIYLVTKTPDGLSGVYRFPEEPGTGTLELVANITLVGKSDPERLATGGDWEPEGDRLVIVSYGRIFEWLTDPCDPDAHWATSPVVTFDGAVSGTEAVAYTPEGDLLTVREGDPMRIALKTCAKIIDPEFPCDDPKDTGVEKPDDTGDTGKGPKDDTSPGDSKSHGDDTCEHCKDSPHGDSATPDHRPPELKSEGCGCNHVAFLLPFGLGFRFRGPRRSGAAPRRAPAPR